MLISSPKQITPEWMTDTFREEGYLSHFRVRDVRLIETRETKTAILYTLRITYSDVGVARQMPETLILKVYNPGYHAADKEVTFYARIIPAMRDRFGDVDLSLVNGYSAYYDISADQSHVLIEEVSKTFKKHFESMPPTKRHISLLGDSLAKIHGFWWEDDRVGHTIGKALTEDTIKTYLDEQKAHYEEFLADGSIVIQSAQKAILDKVVGIIPKKRYENLRAGKTRTLIHGDLHPDNFLYSHNACKILDWKSWRVGVGTDDLAYMMAFYWDVKKRKFEEPHLLKRYWAELRRVGVLDYSYDDFMLDYRISIGMKLADIMGSWDKNAWKTGKWNMWKVIQAGMQVYEEHKVSELYP